MTNLDNEEGDVFTAAIVKIAGTGRSCKIIDESGALSRFHPAF